MSTIDFLIIALVLAAFVAVILRVRKKGTCGDCAQAGACGGACGGACAGCSTRREASCPACEGVDRVAEKLSRNVNGR